MHAAQPFRRRASWVGVLLVLAVSLGVFELFKQLNALGTAVILATHDATLLRRYPETRVLELEGGRLVYDSGAAVVRPPDGGSDDSSIFELMPDGRPLDDPAKQASGSKRAGPAP